MYNIAIRITSEEKSAIEKYRYELTIQKSELSESILKKFKDTNSNERNLFLVYNGTIVGELWGCMPYLKPVLENDCYTREEENDSPKPTETGANVLKMEHCSWWGESAVVVPDDKGQVFELSEELSTAALRCSVISPFQPENNTKAPKMLRGYLFKNVDWKTFVGSVYMVFEKDYKADVHKTREERATSHAVQLYHETAIYDCPTGKIKITYDTRSGFYDTEHDWVSTGKLYRDVLIFRGNEEKGHIMYCVGESWDWEQYRWFAGAVLDVLEAVYTASGRAATFEPISKDDFNNYMNELHKLVIEQS